MKDTKIQGSIKGPQGKQQMGKQREEHIDVKSRTQRVTTAKSSTERMCKADEDRTQMMSKKTELLTKNMHLKKVLYALFLEMQHIHNV